MKRPFARGRKAAVAGVAVLALGLAACSSSGGGGASGTAGSGSSSAATKLSPLLPADIKAAGKLVVAIDQGGASNLGSTDTSGKLIGFDPDIITAIGEKLGLKVEIHGAAFDALLAGVQSGRFDTAQAGMADSKARQESVSFVDYINVGLGLVVKKGNPAKIKDVDNLCGKKVAVNKGGYPLLVAAPKLSKACEAAGRPALNLVVLDDISSLFVALQSGRADVVYNAAANSAFVLAKAPGQFEIIGGKDVLGHAGIAFAKSDEQLGKALQAALQALIDSGEYATIIKKWGMQGWEVPKATINEALL